MQPDAGTPEDHRSRVSTGRGANTGSRHWKHKKTQTQLHTMTSEKNRSERNSNDGKTKMRKRRFQKILLQRHSETKGATQRREGSGPTGSCGPSTAPLGQDRAASALTAASDRPEGGRLQRDGWCSLHTDPGHGRRKSQGSDEPQNDTGSGKEARPRSTFTHLEATAPSHSLAVRGHASQWHI